jgi:hypothetical protein
MDNSDFPLTRLLFSNGPASDRADKMSLYGFLVGDWTMDAVMHTPDGKTHARQGKISFAWILQGRAIQDVWALPGFLLRLDAPRLRPGDRRLAHFLE